MTFRAIATADTLQEYLAPVDALVDECIVHLTSEGLEVAAVDPANVAMVAADLDADAFESYEADGGRIGVDVDRLTDVIGFGDSGDLVHLELDEATRKLDVAVGPLDYTFALIDPDAIRSEPSLPDLDLPGEVVVEGDQLATMADAADMVGDHITFGVDGETFYAAAEGDTDDATIAYDRDDVIDLVATDGVSSFYSLDYVTDCVNAIDSEAEVTVKVGNEQPARWTYHLAEGRGDVEALISPRIQGGDA